VCDCNSGGLSQLHSLGDVRECHRENDAYLILTAGPIGHDRFVRQSFAAHILVYAEMQLSDWLNALTRVDATHTKSLKRLAKKHGRMWQTVNKNHA
jgi:hypothetical protein